MKASVLSIMSIINPSSLRSQSLLATLNWLSIWYITQKSYTYIDLVHKDLPCRFERSFGTARHGGKCRWVNVIPNCNKTNLSFLLQSRIAPNQHILYLVVYIDETNVSTIGGVKVWPVYLWIGNLPASVRKRRRKKGGAILIGYLPKVSVYAFCPL